MLAADALVEGVPDLYLHREHQVTNSEGFQGRKANRQPQLGKAKSWAMPLEEALRPAC